VVEYQDYLIDADDLGEVCEVALVCCPPDPGPEPSGTGGGSSGSGSSGTGGGSGTASSGGSGSSGASSGTGGGDDDFCFCGAHDFAILGGGGGGSSGGSGTGGTGDPTGSGTGSGDDDCSEVEDDPNSPPLWWLQQFRALTCNAFYLDPNMCTCVEHYINNPRADGTYGPGAVRHPCDSIYWPAILAAWQAFLQQHPGGSFLDCLGLPIPPSYGPPVGDIKWIDVEFVGEAVGDPYCVDYEECGCP